MGMNETPDINKGCFLTDVSMSGPEALDRKHGC